MKLVCMTTLLDLLDDADRDRGHHLLNAFELDDLLGDQNGVGGRLLALRRRRRGGTDHGKREQAGHAGFP